MAKTHLQRRMPYYQRVIEEGKNSPHSEKYQTVCHKLEELMNLSDQLKDRKHKMTKREHEQISKSYKELKDACSIYLDKNAQFSEFEEKRKGMIEVIASLAEKDMNELSQYNALQPTSLSEVIEKARTRTIVVNKDDLKHVGGNLSSRIPLKTNNGKQGFFTPKINYDPDKSWREKLAVYEKGFSGVSEEFKEKIELLKKNEKFQLKICNMIPEEVIPGKNMYLPAVKEHMAKLGAAMGIGKSPADVARIFNQHRHFYSDFFDFANSAVKLANQQLIMDATGIKKGANISDRNCAMSDVARLLKCDHLIANSVPMKIVVNGQEIEGVFMETAEGTDLNRLKKDDPIMSADRESFENPKAIEQVADLQVLDFICGNTDRHTGNMVYQFKKSIFGSVTFTGIKGIDNDCAFGTPEIKEKKPIMKMVNPESMRYMTQSMWSKLEHLKKDKLRFVLANDNLSKDEIDAAWDRVEKLKTAVYSKEIQVVGKKFWKTNKLIDMKLGNDYFTRIKRIQYLCSEDHYKGKDPGTKIKYAQEINSANHIMLANEDKIIALRKQMNDSKAMFFNSSEFNLMKSRFDKIEKLTKEIKEKYPQLKNVPPEKTDELRQAYVDLAEKTDKYISLKSLVPSSTRGQMRKDLAEALLDFADTTLEKLSVNLDKETQNEVEEPTLDQDEFMM